jgi:hypothetical protein
MVHLFREFPTFDTSEFSTQAVIIGREVIAVQIGIYNEPDGLLMMSEKPR